MKVVAARTDARRHEGLPRRGVLRHEGGAVFVEHLLALSPVLVLALFAWQSVELWRGDLLVRHAALAAARAAVVVLPDDPAFYGGAEVDRFTGERRAEIELAAALVLAHDPQFSGKPVVQLDHALRHEPLTVSVSAAYGCSPAWARGFCLIPQRQLSASATLAYEGASYLY
jgi:hypothetical protein